MSGEWYTAMADHGGATTQIGGRLLDTPHGPVEAITVAGTDPEAVPILLLHGMSGDARQGLSFLRRLGDASPVVAVSRPGYGATPLRSGRGAAEQADLYVDALDALGIQRAVVVGISAGGPSALLFATRHPDRCAGLVQLCAVVGHLIEVPRTMQVVAKLTPIWDLGALLQSRALRSAAIDADLTASERALLAADPSMASDLRDFLDQASECVRSTRGMRNDVATFIECRRSGPPSWPAGATMPVEIVHGGEDSVVPPAHAEWHGAAIPGARVTVVPGIGHAVPLTAPQACVDAVLRVLSTTR